MFRDKPSFTALKATISSGLIALVLLLGLASSSEQIHEWIHGHGGQVDFQCAVSLFKKGSLENAQTSAPVRFVTLLDLPFADNDMTLVCRIDRLLPPICGPPSLPA